MTSGATPEQLMQLREYRPSYKWKVQQCTAKSATCVAYIDARQVMDILDAVVGPGNWTDDYDMVGGRLVCRLAIKVDGHWITKVDCGSDSSYEAEKGGMSDAFKRSAVKWGIGRFLYDMDIIYIRETVQSGVDNKGKPKYVPTHQGQRIWDLTEHIRKYGLDKSGQNQPEGLIPRPTTLPISTTPSGRPAALPPAGQSTPPPAPDSARLLLLKKQLMAEVFRAYPNMSRDEHLAELEAAADALCHCRLPEITLADAKQLIMFFQKKPAQTEPSLLGRLSQATQDLRDQVLFEADRAGMDVDAAKLWLQSYGYAWETLTESQARHALEMLVAQAPTQLTPPKEAEVPKDASKHPVRMKGPDTVAQFSNAFGV